MKTNHIEAWTLIYEWTFSSTEISLWRLKSTPGPKWRFWFIKSGWRYISILRFETTQASKASLDCHPRPRIQAPILPYPRSIMTEFFQHIFSKLKFGISIRTWIWLKQHNTNEQSSPKVTKTLTPDWNAFCHTEWLSWWEWLKKRRMHNLEPTSFEKICVGKFRSWWISDMEV